jgi:sec-independent protein translocase protein TatA
MMGLGWQELVIVLVIIMIIFGAGKLPQVAKSLGQGVKEFKTEADGGSADARIAADWFGNDEERAVASHEVRAERI